MFLDLDPDSAGLARQMLKYDHKRPNLVVEAASWSEFLEGLADGLEDRRYRDDPDAESVGPPGLWD